MKFGIYVHIPYCLQRCSYCDFATYVHTETIPPQDYLTILKKEIEQRATWIGPRSLDTLYFGGGTPSLLPAEEIGSVIQHLANHGFDLRPETEVTIEINPATIDQKKLESYQKMGINRFSVGAQTFDDQLLKSVRRQHSAQQTRETLELLKLFELNYSFDLLFALPNQSLEILKRDLEEVAKFLPPHMSPYCLTVPESHPLAAIRPHEDTQVEMFELISKELKSLGYHQYEISNFALPGFESRHNCLYWDNDEYWGVGLSSHSYLHRGQWGTRFWNDRSLPKYQSRIDSTRGENLWTGPHPDEVEILKENQSLTDFCHISLRRSLGLSLVALNQSFGPKLAGLVSTELQSLQARGLVSHLNPGHFSLTQEGVMLSNQVFARLTFLEEDLAPRTP